MLHRDRSVAETVTGLLRAENERDWEEYRRYLAPDVEWTTYGPKRATVRGRDRFVEEVKRMYAGRDATFSVERMAVDEPSGIAFVELVIEGLRSADVFRVEDGLIRAESEYLEDGYYGGSHQASPGTVGSDS